MSRLDCSDVCEIVHDRLLALGFKIDPDDEDHADIIEALQQVKFIKEDDQTQETTEASYPDEHGFTLKTFIIYIHGKEEEATDEDFETFVERFNDWCLKNGYSFETSAPHLF